MRNYTERETFPEDAKVLQAMILALRACINSDVQPIRVSGLIRTARMRLSAVRDNLEMLSSNSSTEKTLADSAEILKRDLENGQFDSLQDFELRLGKLEQFAATTEPLTQARVTECRALVAASMQEHQLAADLCHRGAEIQELETVHRWHLIHLQATLLADYGRDFDDDVPLQASIDLLKHKILPLAEELEEPHVLATSLQTLGNVLGMIGQRRNGTRYLEDAISAFGEALKLLNPDTAAMQWAMVQNGLGNALGSLGQRCSDDKLLQQSIEAFEQALTKQSEDSCAHDWASTMNNLAAVLQSLGRKQSDPKLLKRSVNSYKAVLRVWTRTDVPLDWATTMDNLGTALRNLGEYRRGPGTLKQAVAAYNSALAERYRELVPNDWAMTHNNLGAALHRLAQREESSDIMQRATEAYEKTLTEWTHEKVPMTWAMTVANLGVARREFAEMTGDIDVADKAVEELQSAVDVFRSASHAQYTELGEEQLSKARLLLETLVAERDSEATDNSTPTTTDCPVA